MELCDIVPNQAFKGRLLDEHTAEMIKYACQPANVNGQYINNNGLTELGFRPDAGSAHGFGIRISKDMAVVPGRILPRPGVRYGQGTPSVDDRASWNLINVKFAVPGTVAAWAVLVVRDGNRDDFAGPNDPELQATMQGFAAMCRKCGMNFPTNAPPQYASVDLPRKSQQDPTRKESIKAIRATIMTLKKPSFIMVCLSNGDKHIYSGLKHLCDVYLGVHTVCVHSAKVKKERGQMQYFANVALKVNMKMGGVNHQLDNNSVGMGWFTKAAATPTMIVGMDVTHPGPGSLRGTPSIAAVVASVDNKYAQFPASLRIQETKKEVNLRR